MISFYGEKHLLLEQGHMVNQEIPASELFGKYRYTSEMKSEAIAAVHATWDAFEKWQSGIMDTMVIMPQILVNAKSTALPGETSMESF